jgi:hypothetical protein
MMRKRQQEQPTPTEQETNDKPAEPRAADEVAAGEVLEITLGKTTIFPVKFNGFEVGPFTIRGELRPGESYAAGYTRLRSILRDLMSAEIDARQAEYFAILESADRAKRS